jgi:hypothetical protein
MGDAYLARVQSQNFYGVDLSGLRSKALEE